MVFLENMLKKLRNIHQKGLPLLTSPPFRFPYDKKQKALAHGCSAGAAKLTNFAPTGHRKVAGDLVRGGLR